jgi:hypothetical protein
VPSTQMRCVITANRRASATIAFFVPRAIFIAQALSQEHFLSASCFELLRRASSASSHRRSAIFCRSNRSRLNCECRLRTLSSSQNAPESARSQCRYGCTALLYCGPG